MLPKLLLARLAALHSPADYELVLEGFRAERVASFRVNPIKSSLEEVSSFLKKENFKAEPYETIPGAFTLDRSDEYRFKGTDLFRSGKIYMQSLSSLLPVMLLDPEKGSSVLDVCAAPGSKTTQLAGILGNTGRIVALEQSPVRYDTLVHNIRLQWATDVEAIRSEALSYFKTCTEEFDAILLDVPCSAEGRISEKNEKTYGFFSVDNIHRKAKLQQELLAAAFDRLKPGGKLVYSTCTLAPEENEAMVSRFLDTHPATIEPISLSFPEARPGFTEFSGTVYRSEVSGTLRILPSRYFEGFYVAVLRKENP